MYAENFCLLKTAGRDIWSDCEDLFLFLLSWMERNCWQLPRGTVVGVGCGRRNWSKGNTRSLSANTLAKKYIQPLGWKKKMLLEVTKSLNRKTASYFKTEGVKKDFFSLIKAVFSLFERISDEEINDQHRGWSSFEQHDIDSVSW